MTPKIFGAKIATLRKKKGYTQAKFATKLNLSDKTISKWENGLGYPDVTLLPVIAKLLGVSVDNLLSEQNSGITVAGNLIVDIVANIESYPSMGMQTYIQSYSNAVGGCVSNTSIDLAVIDPLMRVSALGCVGKDDYGRFLISKLESKGIDVSGIRVSPKRQTSFTNVMSHPTGERTFFCFSGANADFSPQDVDVSQLDCKILHVGYILLLDKFDQKDEEYGTAMARFLHSVQKQGVKTSIDVVSSTNKSDYAEKVIPSLPYADYVIFNEIECCNTWGIEPRNADGSINLDNVKTAMEKTLASGVGEKVIVHAKEAGFCLSKDGTFSKMGSLIIPTEQIKGSVGAGDAFCAGCLYGIYNDYTDRQILEFASAAAACSLFEANAVDGMKNKSEILKLTKKYGRLEI
ncbi:MAG: helix-turn-helix domain-containing protein [Clostridia bacterium]|nr:helix-turn-helix domain-containing protein [Clostridia bacterium]